MTGVGVADGIRTFAVTCGDMPAHVAVPEGEGRAPCVIVIHERYGLVRHTREIAERFARDGCVAIAPNLFHRHPDQEGLHRGEASCDISDPEALDALIATVAALDAIPQADTSRLAVMGVCQTGRHPLLLAAAREIGAALVWYGAAQPREWAVNSRYPRPLEEIIAAIDCPVLGIFGETDHLISIDDVRRFRDCLERHGKSFSINILPDAPHGFLNDTMPGRYRRAQAEAAWAEQRAFLGAAFAPGRNRSRRVVRYAADIAAEYDFSRNVRME